MVHDKGQFSTKNTAWRIMLGGLMLAYAVIVVRNAWTCDDAYISYRTIDNFVNGYGLVWNVGERVQAFSHPLWLFVLTPFYAVSGNMYFTAIIISILLSLAAVGLYAFRIAEHPLIACTGVAALALSDAFIDYSTSGLENPLTHFLLAIFLYFYFRHELTVRALFYLSLTAALAAVNRLDVLVIYAPMLAYAFWRVKSRRAVMAIVAGFVPLIVWEVFSLIYYGFPLPNPAYAKLDTGLSGVRLLKQGLYYLEASLMIDPLTIAVIAAGILMPFVARNRRAVPAALAILFQMIYILKIGGCFMVGRFLGAPLLAAVIVLTYMYDRSKPRRWMRAVPLVLILALGMISERSPLYSAPGDGPDDFRLQHTICDERRFYNPATGLLNYDSDAPTWPDHDWARKGLELRQAGDTVVVDYTIGMVGFFAGPEAYIIDALGLADPFLGRLPVLKGIRYKTGHYTRRLPVGYQHTVRSGENVIVDTLLADYYDRISLVTRGDIFDSDRLAEIVRFNLGFNDHLVEHYAEPHLITVPIEYIDRRPMERTGWFHYDNIVFGGDGLRIILDRVRHDKMYEIGRDHNDLLRVVYYHDGREVGDQLIRARVTPGGGIVTSRVRVPDPVVTSGYDEMRIVPERGDGQFSVSHIRFIPEKTSP